jgi:hypothetical protein
MNDGDSKASILGPDGPARQQLAGRLGRLVL